MARCQVVRSQGGKEVGLQGGKVESRQDERWQGGKVTR